MAPNIKYFTGFDVTGAAFLIDKSFKIIAASEDAESLGLLRSARSIIGSNIKDVELPGDGVFKSVFLSFMESVFKTDQSSEKVFTAGAYLCRLHAYKLNAFPDRYVVFIELFRPHHKELLQNASDIAEKLLNGSLSALYNESLLLIQTEDFESRREDIKSQIKSANFRQLLSALNFNINYQLNFDFLPLHKLAFEAEYSNSLYSLHAFAIEQDDGARFYFFSMADVSILRLLTHYLHAEQVASAAQSCYNAAIIETSLTGSIVSASGNITQYFQECVDNPAGKFIGDVITGITIHEFNLIKKEIKESGIYSSTLSLMNIEGSKKYFSIRAGSKNIEGGSNIVFVIEDSTYKILEERRLRASEENYRGIAESSGHIILKLDSMGIIVFHNSYTSEYLGYNNADLTGKNFFDFVEPAFAKAKDFDISFLRAHCSSKFELPLKKSNGSLVYAYGGASPILDFNREICGYSCIFADMSFLKMAESILNMKIAVFESAPEGLVLECDKKIVLANRAFLHLFGYEDTSDIIGLNSMSIVAEADAKRASLFIGRRKTEAKLKYEFKGRRKNGSVFTAQISSTNYEIDGKIYTASVVRDFAGLLSLAGKTSEENYSDLIANMSDFLWRVEYAPGRGYGNAFFTPSVIHITGYPEEDFRKDRRLWLRIIHPDDLKEFKKRVKTLLADRLRTSGEIEFRVVNKNGRTVWIRTRIVVRRDPQGNIAALYGQTGDISARKKIEEDLKKSKDDLARLNETKDRFISIISHDLRTPFSSILGFTELLMTETDIPEDQKSKYIGYIHEAGTNILSLVNSLLDWTRLQTGQIKFAPEKINARSVAEKSMNIVLGAAIQKKVEIENAVEDISIYADENLLLQTFNNLLSNAVKFSHTGGKITISSEESRSKDYAQFVVEDNGVGIQAKYVPLLFKIDSKFTLEGTKGEKGSGIGLSLCKDIVNKHGGDIWVESEFGFGSRFKFTIPYAASSILLVDDSLMDRLLYAKIIKNFLPEYTILQASNGKEALDMILSSPPALIITDHLMPEMGGVELLKNLKSPRLQGVPPLIILSADITKSVIDEYNSLGVEYVFQKPVELSVFKKTIEKLLKKRETT